MQDTTPSVFTLKVPSLTERLADQTAAQFLHQEQIIIIIIIIIVFNWYSGGGVQFGPLGTAATQLAYCLSLG
jgi:hypothetical protein